MCTGDSHGSTKSKALLGVGSIVLAGDALLWSLYLASALDLFLLAPCPAFMAASRASYCLWIILALGNCSDRAFLLSLLSPDRAARNEAW